MNPETREATDEIVAELRAWADREIAEYEQGPTPDSCAYDERFASRSLRSTVLALCAAVSVPSTTAASNGGQPGLHTSSDPVPSAHELVAQLQEAVHGQRLAVAASPKTVWRELLAKVRVAVGSREPSTAEIEAALNAWLDARMDPARLTHLQAMKAALIAAREVSPDE